MSKTFLVTGGAGFIGSAVVRYAIRETDYRVVVVDKLTYAGNLESLAPVSNDPRYSFVRADITDAPKMRDLLEAYQPDVIMHLAAESHVDRSIDGPGDFVLTNVVGTYTLLQAALHYWRDLPPQRKMISASTIFQPMRCSESWRDRHRSWKQPLLIPARPMPRRRHPPIISSAPGTIPMGCRR